jgi:phosphoglycerol geranylgeranyltransferase
MSQYLSVKDHAQFILLLDPDKLPIENIKSVVESSIQCNVDIFFIGSSLIIDSNFDLFCEEVKKYSADKSVIIFPGGSMQVSKHADGILFMSLISGRNPDFLIGQQVLAAANVKRSGIEAIPTAYMLVESGVTTSVEFMSNTKPLPPEKADIAAAHAMAAELLGFKLIYLEGGSGAKHSVSNKLIYAVKKSANLPLIVGGGIRTPEIAKEKVRAGANFIVCGTVFENNTYDINLITSIVQAIHEG